MLTIDNTGKYGKQSGDFGIPIWSKGLIRPDLNDSGFPRLEGLNMPGSLIPMSAHKNDEILS